MTTIGVVGIPSGWSSRMLTLAFEQLGCIAHQIDMAEVVVDLQNASAHYRDIDLTKLDAIVVKKIGTPYRPELLNRLAMLRYVGGQNVPIFSNPFNIKRVIDRLSCTVTLRLHDIPMPPTIVTEDIDRAAEAVRGFKKAVLKPLYTSKAQGMVLLNADDDLSKEISAYKNAGNELIYVQQMLDLPGHDLGIVFMGGEYVTCYARVGDQNSWNTTIRDGGRYQPVDPSDEIIALAKRAQAPFDLDFTCVDIAETNIGPIVFEVSAFGGFRGLWDARKIDAANLYANYVLKRIGHDA